MITSFIFFFFKQIIYFKRGNFEKSSWLFFYTFALLFGNPNRTMKLIKNLESLKIKPSNFPKISTTSLGSCNQLLPSDNCWLCPVLITFFYIAMAVDWLSINIKNIPVAVRVSTHTQIFNVCKQKYSHTLEMCTLTPTHTIVKYRLVNG